MAKYEIKDGVGIIPEGTTKIESKAFFGEITLKSGYSRFGYLDRNVGFH